MSATAIATVAGRATGARPRWWHRVARVGLVAAVLGVIAMGATSAGAYYVQQQALRQAVAQRDAAQHRVDDVLARARSGGVNASQLASVAQKEHAILAEPAAQSTRWFDDSETQHVRDQTVALSGLVGRVASVQTAATRLYSNGVDPVMQQFDSAIQQASTTGIDVQDDKTTLAAAQGNIAVAASPHDVGVAVAGIAERTAALTQETNDYLMAQSELTSSMNTAQSQLTRADTVLAAAQQHPQLQINSWGTQLATEHKAFHVATSVSAYGAVASSAGSVADGLQGLLDARFAAYNDMSSARLTVQQANTLNIAPENVPAQLDGLQPGLDTDGTTDAFNASRAAIENVISPLHAQVIVATLGSGKVIYVSLANQQLTAYENGNVFVTTPVTTGRAALPTPPGNYTVLRMNHPWTMVSPWGPGSPFWYPSSEVQYTLWFRNDGYAIHDAPWRLAYGPGSEANGSHGCINVPFPAMQQLWGWSSLGLKVVVQ